MNAGGVSKACKSNAYSNISMANGRVTHWQSAPKTRIISRKAGQYSIVLKSSSFLIKAPALREEPMAYQLVGEVTAHQGYDGYGVREHDPTHWD